jgi:hypothetical protein
MDGQSDAALDKSDKHIAASEKVEQPIGGKPPIQKPNTTGGTKPKEKCACLKRAWRKSSLTDWLIVVLYFGLLVIGIGQVSLTINANKQSAEANGAAKQAFEETKKSNEQSLDNAKQQLRAWLGVNEAHADSLEVGSIAQVTVIIENTGATPGTINKWSGVVMAGEEDKKEFKIVVDIYSGKYDPDDTKDSTHFPLGALARLRADTTDPLNPKIIPVRESSIAPHGKEKFHFRGKGKLTKDDIDEINDGRWPLLVIGYIGYKDAFGGDHHTSFWLRYDFISKTFSGAENGNEMN